MNVRKLSQAIGARVLVSFPVGSGSLKSNGSIGVHCTVRDVRKVWARVDLLVAPESGSGEGWVSLSRIERTNEGVCDFAAQLTA